MKYKRIYQIWYAMVSRCTVPTYHQYESYGGRGITVCEEWKQFADFLAWVLSSDYDPAKTIDRKDNNAGYAPDNCRWATSKEQGRNKRNNIILEHEGQAKTLPEWAEVAGISYIAMWQRLYSCGWTLKEAISMPIIPFAQRNVWRSTQ